MIFNEYYKSVNWWTIDDVGILTSKKNFDTSIKSGDLNISPDFLRNEVWDSFRKSRLIESILLRIPLPVFYFSEDEKGVLSVVDGLHL